MDTPSGAMVARAILLCCSVDLPARAMITNMKQFNGKHGCLYCEDEGTVIGSDHLHRYWPQKTSCTSRTHQSVLSNATDAIATGSVVRSPMQSDFKCYNYVTGMWC